MSSTRVQPASATRALASEIERLFAELLRQAGRFSCVGGGELSPTQRLALGYLVDRGPLRVRALAECMGTTDATASRTVDALVAAGLVDRDADPADRRAVQIDATAAGREAIRARRRVLEQLLGGLLDDMPAREVERLAALLAGLNERLETLPPPG